MVVGVPKIADGNGDGKHVAARHSEGRGKPGLINVVSLPDSTGTLCKSAYLIYNTPPSSYHAAPVVQFRSSFGAVCVVG